MKLSTSAGDSKNDEKFELKIEKAITKLDERITEKIQNSLQPLESRQTNTESQIEVSKAQMQKYTEATESNTKTIIESNQQLTKKTNKTK